MKLLLWVSNDRPSTVASSTSSVTDPRLTSSERRHGHGCSGQLRPPWLRRCRASVSYILGVVFENGDDGFEQAIKAGQRSLLARITVGDSLAIVAIRESCLKALSFVVEGYSWYERKVCVFQDRAESDYVSGVGVPQKTNTNPK